MGAPELLTAAEASDLFRVSPKTLAKMRSAGLRYVQLTRGTIRYRADDIQEFIAARTVEDAPCHTARKARVSGITTSKSGVVDFTALAARKTTKKPRR